MIRTRFAPSPTGSLHVGNARIAVLNWLFTRQQGGHFLLRIEDTDIARNVEGSESQIFEDLRWLGLDWDEGPPWDGRPFPGPHEPYRQSERSHIYKAAAEELVRRNAAFECFCAETPPDDPEEEHTESQRHICSCLELTNAQKDALRNAGQAAALRFRVPADTEIVVRDEIFGDVRFASREISHFVVLRADGRPTYNFAVVVDDIAMEITHVIRGSGHLSNTPRQVLLYEAFAKPAPVFAHIPMVLGPDRQKLSKRHGAQAVADYRRQGYLPDALVNYLSLLSWSSPGGEEVLTRDQLIREISLSRIGAADVMYDPAKLRWLSSKHMERMPLAELVDAVKPFLGEYGRRVPEQHLQAAIESVRTHLATLSDAEEHLVAFYPLEDSTWAPENDAEAQVIRMAATQLNAVSAWERAPLEAALKETSKLTGARGRDLYVPLRYALTGREHGPPFWAVLVVQGREAVLTRLSAAAAAAR